MGIKSFCFLFTILLFSSFCNGNDKSVIEVVGYGDCADCEEDNIKTSQAFSGLHVTIDCKAPNGEIKTRGEGNLDDQGKFIVSLPKEIVENGKLKKECFAKLLNASHKPCPTHNGIDSSKLIFKTKTNGKHIFTTSQKLKFSPITCISKIFLKHFMYPPLPKWKKHFLFYKKPCPPLAPIFKKPLPSTIPIYKPTPKPPVYKSPPYVKPLPPSVPVYKPKPKPKPPVYKPKLKPPVYESKPKPLVFKPPPYAKPLPPPVPIYKKPLPPFYKPFPSFPKIPKKPPCPPLPKLPPYPKIPKKYFHHPIFAPWPTNSP